MIKVKDFPVFEAGSYPQGEFDEGKVEEIVSSYDPAKLTAGAVLGHSSDYDTKVPNLGIIHGLKKVGKQIWTNGVELAESLVQAIKEKAIKYPSVELYGPDDPANPTPGKLYLGNIGFLGAKNPAVKGLPLLSTALGFTEKKGTPISIEQPKIGFEEMEMEKVEKATNEETYDKIKLEFAQCLNKVWDYLESADDDEEKKSKCSLAVSDCYWAVNRAVEEHFSFLEKAESVLEKITNSLSEMAEWLKGRKPNKQSTKEADMDKKEFQEAQAKIDADKAELERQRVEFAAKEAEMKKKELEFAEIEKARKAEEARQKTEQNKARVAEFKEDLLKQNYPIKKMEEQHLFELAEKLLDQNDLEFGEEKKNPFDILKSLFATFKPVTTGSEFKEEEIKSIGETAKKLNIPAGAHVSAEGMAKVQFAEAYLAKHKDKIPGDTEQQKLANVMTKIMMGEIAFDQRLLN